MVDGEVEVEQLQVDKTRPPLLGTALNRVVGAITSQTISAELEELDRHNEAVVRTRGTRVSLARMGTKLGKAFVDEGIRADYRRRRVQRTRWLWSGRPCVGSARTSRRSGLPEPTQYLSTVPRRS